MPPYDCVPVPSIPLVGRANELQWLIRCLYNPQRRLTLLVGEGGIGKTHLALAAVHTMRKQAATNGRPLPWRDGICLVNLANVARVADEPITTALQVASAIGRACALTFTGSVDIGEQIQLYLRDRHLLLILDNFEHLVAATPWLVTLLHQAPALHILVTSRLQFAVDGGQLLRLSGLSLPPLDSTNDLTDTQLSLLSRQDERSFAAAKVYATRRYAGIAFFCECAARIQPDFQLSSANYAAVTAICRFVGGSPLGIQLAAALLPQYSCDALADHLLRDYTILATDRIDLPLRQRNIQTLLTSAWQMLSPEEAKVMAQCSVLGVTFARDAALAVTCATTTILRTLLHKSFLTYDAETQIIFVYEVIHQFAAQMLTQQPALAHGARLRHAAFYMALLQTHEQDMLRDLTCFRTMRAAWQNLVNAWQWAVEQMQLELLKQAAPGFSHLCRLSGLFLPGTELFTAAITAVRTGLAGAPTAEGRATLAALLNGVVQFYYYQGNEAAVNAIASELVSLSSEFKDWTLRGSAYNALAWSAHLRGDHRLMLTASEQARVLLQAEGTPWTIANSLATVSTALLAQMKIPEAVAYYQQALTLLQEMPDPDLMGRIYDNLGIAYLVRRDFDAAIYYLHKAGELGELVNNQRRVALSSLLLMDVWRELGLSAKAQAAYHIASTYFQVVNEPQWRTWLYIGYGRLLESQGAGDEAYRQYMQAFQLTQSSNQRFYEHRVAIFLGQLLINRGAPIQAYAFYQRALVLQQWFGFTRSSADLAAGLACLAHAAQENEQAMQYTEQALQIIAQQGTVAADDLYWVYQQCIVIMQTIDEHRAAQLLSDAQQLLYAEIAKLQDQAACAAFLKKVSTYYPVLYLNLHNS